MLRLLGFLVAMNETLLIHFSGRDRPGLIAELTALLAAYDACVLDIGQAVVHETLSLGLLVEIPQGESSRGLQSALLATTRALQLQVQFTTVGQAELDEWVVSQGRDQFPHYRAGPRNQRQPSRARERHCGRTWPECSPHRTTLWPLVVGRAHSPR